MAGVKDISLDFKRTWKALKKYHGKSMDLRIRVTTLKVVIKHGHFTVSESFMIKTKKTR